jgi:hypothetical protein
MAMSPVERHLVEYALLVALPPAGIWAVLHAGEIGTRVAAVARRLRRSEPAPARNPPLERIAADLCRLSLKMNSLPPGTSAVKRTAVRMAYDDSLIAACHALEVPQSLGELGDRLDRELERLRVEDALEHAGLHFRPANH